MNHIPEIEPDYVSPSGHLYWLLGTFDPDEDDDDREEGYGDDDQWPFGDDEDYPEEL